MTDQEWGKIFEKLREPLKQGFEMLSNGRQIAQCQIGSITLEPQPGMRITSAIFCFLTVEGMSDVLESVAAGVQRRDEIAVAKIQEAMSNRSGIILPGANKGPFGAH